MGHSTNVLILRAGISFKWNIYYIATHYIDYYANFSFYYRGLIVYIYYLFRFKYLNIFYLKGIMLGKVRLNIGYNENYFKVIIYLYDENYFRLKFFFFNSYFLWFILSRKKYRSGAYSSLLVKKSYSKLFRKRSLSDIKFDYFLYYKLRKSRFFFNFFFKKIFKGSRVFLKSRRKFSNNQIVNKFLKISKNFLKKRMKRSYFLITNLVKKSLNVRFLFFFKRSKYKYYVDYLFKLYFFFRRYFSNNFFFIILFLFLLIERKNFYMGECKYLFFKLIKYNKFKFLKQIFWFLNFKYMKKKKYRINLLKFQFKLYILYFYSLFKSYFLLINMRYIYRCVKDYKIKINLVLRKKKSIFNFLINYLRNKFFLFFIDKLFNFVNLRYQINYKFLFFSFYIIYRLYFIKRIYKRLVYRIKKKFKFYKYKLLKRYLYLKFYLNSLVFIKFILIQNDYVKFKKLVIFLYKKLFFWFYYYFICKYIKKIYMIYYKYLKIFLLNKLFFLLKNNKIFLKNDSIKFIPLGEETISSGLILLLFRWKFNRRFTMNQIVWPFIRALSIYKNRVIKGFFVRAAGRFTSRQRASLFKYGYGRINFSTFKIYLIYDVINIVSRHGTGGVKMWITLRVKKYRKFNSFYLIKNV